MKQRRAVTADGANLGHWDPDGGSLGRIGHEGERVVIDTERRHYGTVSSDPDCRFDVRTAFVWGFGEKEVEFIDGV